MRNWPFFAFQRLPIVWHVMEMCTGTLTDVLACFRELIPPPPWGTCLHRSSRWVLHSSLHSAIFTLCFPKGPLREKGDEDPDGRARCCGEDHHSLQAQAWRDCHYYPHHRSVHDDVGRRWTIVPHPAGVLQGVDEWHWMLNGNAVRFCCLCWCQVVVKRL